MFILTWLEWIVSWVMVAFHRVFTTIGLNPNGGWAWGLSIVGLVLVIRVALIPVFVKQIKAQRGMQTIQPKIKEIQKKFAGDRERQSQEMMKLYKETGTNPFASCLPIVLQAPVFIALYRVLHGVATNSPLGVFKTQPVLFASAHAAKILGAPISASFVSPGTLHPGWTKTVALMFIILMTATTFITQRQIMVKNMPSDNPMAQQQKILLYVFPVFFFVFGLNFPIGVLIYWLTTNLWSMGQQFVVIRRMPSPGTEAHNARQARLEKKASSGTGKVITAKPSDVVSDNDGAADGAPTGTAGTNGTGSANGTGSGGGKEGRPSAPGRQQPKNQSKSKRQVPKKR